MVIQLFLFKVSFVVVKTDLVPHQRVQLPQLVISGFGAGQFVKKLLLARRFVFRFNVRVVPLLALVT